MLLKESTEPRVEEATIREWLLKESTEPRVEEATIREQPLSSIYGIYYLPYNNSTSLTNRKLDHVIRKIPLSLIQQKYPQLENGLSKRV